MLLWLLGLIVQLILGAYAVVAAFQIRLYAVQNYGLVIHEFDPWFNYRAAEYLNQHGASRFFKWYDHMSWYPLGRPVGTTIYPGMQFAAVWIHQVLDFMGQPMSLNDVCVYLPAWFGVVATVFLGLLAAECAGSSLAGVAAACVMSVIPAHLMRSVAGAYDNECVAIPALCCTFYFWCLSLRNSWTWPIGVLTGLAYFCMVASWGGYIFVVNLIGLHAFILVCLGRFSFKLHLAYSLFYVIGTAMAIQLPVIGTTPLRSLEQMAPLGVFGLLQLLAYCEAIYRRSDMSERDFVAYRRKVFRNVGIVAAVVAAALFQIGYFGPISARVRGLFVQHTRTGNPLVDSVAEHQATSPMAYWHYLYFMCYLAPVGFVMCFFGMKDAKVFAALYAVIAYYFSAKMNRLVLLMSPISAVLGGMAIAGGIQWAMTELSEGVEELLGTGEPQEEKAAAGKAAGKKGAKAGKQEPAKATKQKRSRDEGVFMKVLGPVKEVYNEAKIVRKLVAGLLPLGVVIIWQGFHSYSFRMAEGMSEPSIMFRSRASNGETLIIDDYREAYWWLRDNTPKDARVMAWWDYGYQIAGVANRTTIADGNTWNHEHIATLGLCLTSSEKKAHEMIRHLADYVLVWAGNSADDLAKSPHMARIANSVFPDLCPNDPTCSHFSIDQNGEPTTMMAESLLYKMVNHKKKPRVQMNSKLFTESYTSKYGLVRIFKVMNVVRESKEWVADPKNKLCDAGGWYCPGQYPPGVQHVIDKRRNFKQLEDFNTGTDKEAEEYQKAYHERMSGRVPR